MIVCGEHSFDLCGTVGTGCGSGHVCQTWWLSLYFSYGYVCGTVGTGCGSGYVCLTWWLSLYFSYGYVCGTVGTGCGSGHVCLTWWLSLYFSYDFQHTKFFMLLAGCQYPAITWILFFSIVSSSLFPFHHFCLTFLCHELGLHMDAKCSPGFTVIIAVHHPLLLGFCVCSHFPAYWRIHAYLVLPAIQRAVFRVWSPPMAGLAAEEGQWGQLSW